MALITCMECGKEVSDQAEFCPNCGIPMKHTVDKKYCQHCGNQIDKDCVVCPLCGKQVAELQSAPREQPIIFNNNSSSVNQSSYPMGQPKNKWISLVLCIFTLIGHKIYEGKYGMAVLYFFTAGLCGIGWAIDIVSILLKPETYYV